MTKRKEIFQFDVIVIGAGVVGLAIAYELSKSFKKILVLEKETTFGRHVSSRNSEVIHSGFYYEPGSLKANSVSGVISSCTILRKRMQLIIKSAEKS